MRYTTTDGPKKPLNAIQEGSLGGKMGIADTVAHQRLYFLTGTHDYWKVYQLALAYFTCANSVLVHEIPETIRAKLTTTKLKHPHCQIVEECAKHAKEQDDESHKYLCLIDEFVILSNALESERYRFKTIKVFRNKPEVLESIERIKKLYAELEKTAE